MAKDILECGRCHRRRYADRLTARIQDGKLVVRCVSTKSCKWARRDAKRKGSNV